MYSIAKGIVLNINSKSAGGVTSIGGVEISADTEETTSVTDTHGYRSFMPTLRDGGEVAIEFLHDPNDEGQKELQAAKEQDEAFPCEIVFPPAMGLKWSFNAFVSKYKAGEAAPGGLMKASASLRISGQPALESTGAAAG